MEGGVSTYQHPPPLGVRNSGENHEKTVFFCKKPKIQLIFPLHPRQILNGYYSLKNIFLALIQN